MREVEARLKISAIDRTGRVLSNVGNKLENISRKTMLVNQAQSAMMSQLAYAARYAVPAALAYEMVRATNKAADFEQSLFNIQKKSGATAEQMNVMGREIRDLSKEVPVSIDEIAAAYERAAAGGLDPAKFREFAKLTTQVADGWEVSAEDAGNFFMGFNKSLGISMEKMPAFASLINDLADSGIADEKDVADFVDRVGASLANFGMTPEEIAAYGSAMLNLKIPSEVGARAMDTLSGKLLAPENLGKKPAAALKEIVGDMKSFSKLTGNAKMMFFLKEVQKLTSQKRASLLGALLGEGFDDETMRLVGGLAEVERNLQMVERHTAKPSNSIAGISEKKLDLFNSKLAILKNRLGDIETSMGERILPYAEKAVDAINNVLQANDDYDRGKQKISQGDEGLARFSQKEFIDDFTKRGLQMFLKQDGTRMEALTSYFDGVRSVGKGEFNTLQEYLDSIDHRYDPKGKYRDQESRTKRADYRPGLPTEDPLNAYPTKFMDPDKDIAPIPADTRQQALDAIRNAKTVDAYSAAENFGRDKVSNAIQILRDANEAKAERTSAIQRTKDGPDHFDRLLDFNFNVFADAVEALNNGSMAEIFKDGKADAKPDLINDLLGINYQIATAVLDKVQADTRLPTFDQGSKLEPRTTHDPYDLRRFDRDRSRMQDARDQTGAQVEDQHAIDRVRRIAALERADRETLRGREGQKPDDAGTAVSEDGFSESYKKTASEMADLTLQFEQGGQKAADRITEGASSGGQTLGDKAAAALLAAASSIGQQIGAQAAQAITAAAAGIKINVNNSGTAPVVNANRGVQNPQKTGQTARLGHQ